MAVGGTDSRTYRDITTCHLCKLKQSHTDSIVGTTEDPSHEKSSIPARGRRVHCQPPSTPSCTFCAHRKDRYVRYVTLRVRHAVKYGYGRVHGPFKIIGTAPTPLPLSFPSYSSCPAAEFGQCEYASQSVMKSSQCVYEDQPLFGAVWDRWNLRMSGYAIHGSTPTAAFAHESPATCACTCAEYSPSRRLEVLIDLQIDLSFGTTHLIATSKRLTLGFETMRTHHRTVLIKQFGRRVVKGFGINAASEGSANTEDAASRALDDTITSLIADIKSGLVSHADTEMNDTLGRARRRLGEVHADIPIYEEALQVCMRLKQTCRLPNYMRHRYHPYPFSRSHSRPDVEEKGRDTSSYSRNNRAVKAASGVAKRIRGEGPIRGLRYARQRSAGDQSNTRSAIREKTRRPDNTIDRSGGSENRYKSGAGASGRPQATLKHPKHPRVGPSEVRSAREPISTHNRMPVNSTGPSRHLHNNTRPLGRHGRSKLHLSYVPSPGSVNRHSHRDE